MPAIFKKTSLNLISNIKPKMETIFSTSKSKPEPLQTFFTYYDQAGLLNVELMPANHIIKETAEINPFS